MSNLTHRRWLTGPKLMCLLSLLALVLLSGCSGGSSVPTYTISGRVTSETGDGAEGVRIYVNGAGISGTATTDSDGNWSKDGLQGEVTVTPFNLEGWVFEPQSLSVDSASSTVDFQWSGFLVGVPDSEFTIDSTTGTITDYTGSRDVIIPAMIEGVAVEHIGSYAFQQKIITSVSIPDSVITIDEAAFLANPLTSVTIPDSVETIGNDAFCIGYLSSVIIGNSVVTIGRQAFAYNRLTSVTIPENVRNIGDGAFEANELTTITIGNNVTIGGYNALGKYGEKFKRTYKYVEDEMAGTYVWLGTGWVRR